MSEEIPLHELNRQYREVSKRLAGAEVKEMAEQPEPEPTPAPKPKRKPRTVKKKA